MPIATINILEGRSDEKKEALIREVTDAIARAIDVPTDNIHILINEMSLQNYGVAGESTKKKRGG